MCLDINTFVDKLLIAESGSTFLSEEMISYCIADPIA